MNEVVELTPEDLDQVGGGHGQMDPVAFNASGGWDPTSFNIKDGQGGL